MIQIYFCIIQMLIKLSEIYNINMSQLCDWFTVNRLNLILNKTCHV